jgi:predicted DCC family thiol-disulfide oxidoreductase YuxK
MHEKSPPPRIGAAPLTVFFDGGCPLCSREIAFYRARRGADRLHWVDVSECGSEWVAPDLTLEAARRRFHVMHADGRVVSGARAFADLWSDLPAFALLGRLGRRALPAALLEVCYRLFLRLRPWLQRRLRSTLITSPGAPVTNSTPRPPGSEQAPEQ